MDNNFVDKILEITKDKDYLDNHVKQAKVKEYKDQIYPARGGQTDGLQTI